MGERRLLEQGNSMDMSTSSFEVRQAEDIRAPCRCACNQMNPPDRHGPENDCEDESEMAPEDLFLDTCDGDDDNESVDGDEGAAERMLDVGDLGVVSERVVMRDLERHNRLIRIGILPSEDEYEYMEVNTPAGSGPLSESMMVEHPSGGESAISSIVVSSSSSSGFLFARPSPESQLRDVGTCMPPAPTPPMPASYFNGSPLCLTYERGYCLGGTDISGGMRGPSTPRYVPELNLDEIVESLRPEHDLW